MLSPDSLRPNAEYYIGKVIVPPLNRCFSLVGADAMQWSVRSKALCSKGLGSM